MRTQVNFPIFIVLIALFAFSCSQEDVSTPEVFKVAKQQVQFDFNTTEEAQEEGQNQFNATISSVDPLVLESAELEVFEYFDHQSNTVKKGMVKKDSNTLLQLTNSNDGPCEKKYWDGYIWSPHTLCFYGGYFTQYPNCYIEFTQWDPEWHGEGVPGDIVCIADLLTGL
ncbi:hypothetical protein M3P19_01660 [Muricauda sp. 2012CJ35-5]|uniref:Lipoprotein n=1 Tax=Flagellimonas spongiicola TaxID=2942208 RepID=A0ABT0PN80_9FLAO|nr:hypothetical protein [Allomuricauda spongiicola]MCL6272691.1 hypothetical protein [Allomuricauda spongiicola]